MCFRLRHLGYILPGVLLAMIVPGCKRPPENVKVPERVFGPPDLVKQQQNDPSNQSYQLSAFHVNHMWSTAGGGDRTYRAKITVWDYANDISPIAELYFDDTNNAGSSGNPDPNRVKRPYQIHFPATMMAPVVGTLRNTNEPIFLYYYDGAWAVGTYSREPIGID